MHQKRHTPTGIGIYSKELKIATSLPMITGTSIFAAELTAIYKALQLVKEDGKNIVILPDSKSAIEAIDQCGLNIKAYHLPLTIKKYHN